jgi:glycosyltransferase involved in cell wall biosynthesis
MIPSATAQRTAVPTTRQLFPYGLSVFFPAYNDAPSLPALINKTFQVLEENARDFEVIVVNDGSADNTGEVLAELVKVHGSRMRVITHPENRGYGGALRTGFAEATKDFVFYTDGDGQYDTGELPALLEAVWPDVGLVNGYKTRRQDPWHRIVIGAMYNQFARFLFRVKLRDVDCDFRLIRRSLIERANLRSSSGTICVELVKRLESSGMRIVEVPVSHYPRFHGRSQFFRVKSLAVTFGQLWRLYFQLVLRGPENR